MSENPINIPLPAIVFISTLIGCIFILCIIYQLLKRDKCCQVHGREEAETEEIEQLISVENEGKENIDPDHPAHPVHPDQSADTTRDTTIINQSTEQPDGQITGDMTVDLSISNASSFPSIDLLPFDEEPVSNCGRLLMETTFSPVAKKMTISVVRAADIPGPDRGGTPMVQVHLTILPNRKFKFRTRQKPAESPVFNEKFVLYPVTLEMLQEMSMRVRLYGRKKFSTKILGELEILMTEIDLHSDLSDEPMWKTLLPYGMVAKLATQRELLLEEEDEEQMQ